MRDKVITWWISLEESTKIKLTNKNSDLLGKDREWKSLTRGEIEIVYKMRYNIEDDVTHLVWIYYRLINVHKEDINYDYIIKLKQIILKEINKYDN